MTKNCEIHHYLPPEQLCCCIWIKGLVLTECVDAQRKSCIISDGLKWVWNDSSWMIIMCLFLNLYPINSFSINEDLFFQPVCFCRPSRCFNSPLTPSPIGQLHLTGLAFAYLWRKPIGLHDQNAAGVQVIGVAVDGFIPVTLGEWDIKPTVERIMVCLSWDYL